MSGEDVLEIAMDLADSSLLQSKPSQNETRLYMLETIREFATEELRGSKRETTFKEAHIRDYLALAEDSTKELFGPDSEKWSAILAEEQSNFRAAITYSIELNVLEKAYRIGIALKHYWGSKGMLVEGIQELKKLTVLPYAKSIYPERLKLQRQLAILYLYVPIFAKAISVHEEGLQFWRC